MKEVQKGTDASEIGLGYAGIEFIPATKASERGLGGYWGMSLHKPMFSSRAEMAVQMGNLDSVDGLPVYDVDMAKGAATLIKGYKHIRSKTTGKTYAIMSEQYKPVQDIDVARPVFEVAEELDLEVAGSFHGVGLGRTTAYVLFTNLSLIDLGLDMGVGHEWRDWAGLGLTYGNSYTGETSVWGSMFYHRKICSNYANMSDLLGHIKVAHRGTEGLKGLEQGFKNLIKSSIAKIPELQERIDKARKTVIVDVELKDALWGVGDAIPITAIDDLVAAPEKYAPELIPGKMTVYDSHSMLTAWVSWKAGGVNDPRYVDRVSSAAQKLLMTDIDDLIKKGKERREAYEQALRDKAQKKMEKERKEAEAIVLAQTQGRAF